MSLLFSNNAQTTLGSALSTSATQLTVAAGAGTEFPNPGAGDYFVATLADQTTQTIREIVWVTQRVGDTFYIERAQEGLPARAWAVGDVVANWLTAGQMQAFLQIGSSAAGGDLTGDYPDPTIAAGAVTAPKIAGGAVTAGAIAAGAVTAPAIAASAVTNAAIAAGAVGTVQLGSQVVQNVKLAAMPPGTVKVNDTGSAASPQDITYGLLFQRLGFGASNVGNPGYITLPGSPVPMVIQWGMVAVAGSGASHAIAFVDFPIVFPRVCIGVWCNATTNDTNNPNGTGNNLLAIPYNRDAPNNGGWADYGFGIRLDSEQGNNLSGSFYVCWLAIGN